MSFVRKYATWFKRILPSPFSIALLLTCIVFFVAWYNSEQSASHLLKEWQEGLWNSNLLAFAFQMMLMLVLGYTLALTHFFERIINTIIHPIKTNAQAAGLVALTTIIVALFNWGLGLIFGAIIVRKIGENFTLRKLELNYPLIGASGYLGLMVWHGGISGSALAKAAENNHIQQITQNSTLPDHISFGETVFSTMNLVTTVLLLLILPGVAYVLGRISKTQIPSIQTVKKEEKVESLSEGAERLDTSKIIGKLVGIIGVVTAVYLAISARNNLGFINPNYINFCLLSLNLMFHQNIRRFLQSVNQTIQGASGILIQFPLYFGILALMQSGGLIESISQGFITLSNTFTLPIYTFISAGIVNIFVPSGGGQWALQGPIILDAANQLNVPLPKIILALAYGDQITNMLQPFWALPLLSITGLKAKEILPYSLLFMLVGILIFISVLIRF